MTRKPVRGLFITGTDTEIGKTYVGARIAEALVAAGHRVGVYKPAASGCHTQEGTLMSDDALALWRAAGQPLSLEQVCPQCFAAPLAPHLAARAEGRTLDARLLRTGLDPWLAASDVVLIEGAGGLMSPLGDDQYVADLAHDLGFPLVVVARNALGTINHVLQTLITAATFGDGLPVAGIVLNRTTAAEDASTATNAAEIRQRAVSPLLAELEFGAQTFSRTVDWYALAAPARGDDADEDSDDSSEETA
jgi:dethiobiotin synthetase